MTFCGLSLKASSPPHSNKTANGSAKRSRAFSRAPASAEALANAVERSIEHRDAENVLADLRRRRKVTRQKLAEIGGVGVTEVERRLFQEELTLERQIHAAARELQPLRAAHGRRVEQALRPEAHAAAAAALAAIAEAEAAIGRLNGLREQVRLVGGATPTVSPKPLEIVRLLLEAALRKGEAA